MLKGYGFSAQLVKAFCKTSIDLNDKEATEMSRIINLLRLYYPRLLKKNDRNFIAFSIPFLNFYNWAFASLGFPQKAKKVIPKP